VSSRATRREALRRAALVTGAASAPALLRPAIAVAQVEEEPAGLEEFLVEAVVLEQMSALAYATAASELGDGDRSLQRTLTRFERQEQIHANALRSALDSIGVDPPEAPAAPDDLQAIENVEALDADRTEELSERLAELGDVEGRDDYLELLVRLEDEQIGFYLREAPGLSPEDILRVGVEIAACHAQHAVVLREALGVPLAQTIPELPAE
jgi:rubrerythrin